MSVFKISDERKASLSSSYDVTIATIKRNLITDWNYKSDIVIQLLWTITNLVAYGFLGFAVGEGTGEFAPPYSMSLFLLASSAFWTMFTGNYEETSFCYFVMLRINCLELKRKNHTLYDWSDIYDLF